MKKLLILLTYFIFSNIFLLNPILCQTNSELSAKIDSLQAIEFRLTKKLDLIKKELKELVQKKIQNETYNKLEQDSEESSILTKMKMNIELKDKPGIFGKNITPIIPRGTLVYVLSYDIKGDWKVKVKDRDYIGFTDKDFLYMNDEMKALINKAKMKNEIKIKEQKERNALKKRELINKWKTVGDSIFTEIKVSCKLKDKPSFGGKEITPLLPVGTTLAVLDYDVKFRDFRIKTFYENKEHLGYINKDYLVVNNPMQKLIEETTKLAEAKANKIREKASKKRHQSLIKRFGKRNGEKIFKGVIWIGMTKEMALESWGKPEDINRTVSVLSVHEQWVYGNAYLYFEGGILTSWQD